MQSLRGSRRLARIVAAWLLVWFAAMQGTALLRAPAALGAVEIAADGTGAADTVDDGHAAHEAHAPAHEEHTGADHIAQCPGCLFSTAPPPTDFALAQAVHARAEAPAVPVGSPPRAHPLPLPPARGPPRLS
jgi:hypothetical protein